MDRTVIFAILMTLVVSAKADTYRCVSGNGSIAYQQKPCVAASNAADREPLAGPEEADSDNTPAWQDNCRSMSVAAKSIMKARQDGASMADLIDAAEVNGGALAGVIQGMIVLAYEKPGYSSAKFKEKASTDFANEAYLACAKALKQN